MGLGGKKEKEINILASIWLWWKTNGYRNTMHF